MDGVINIYKEKGYTSHDAVAIVKRELRMKAGHTGTLDPMAEGVLPVCVGRATKLSAYIMNGVKAYRAELILGSVTDTQDSGGTVLEQRPVTVSRGEITACALSFAGGYDQLPPMYSAVKVNGQRLYKLAREGVTVEREPRTVEIHSIDVDFISDTTAVIDVVCGKGTYIRTLCADIGQKLGCGAHMGSLLRTRSGDFTLESAVRVDELRRLAKEGRAEECVIPITRLLSRYKSVKVKKDAEKYLRNGNKLHCGNLSGGCELAEGEKILLCDPENKPAALYRHTENMLKCEIML